MHSASSSVLWHSPKEQRANVERHGQPVGTERHHQITSPIRKPWTRQLHVKDFGNPIAPGLLSHPTVRGDHYPEAGIHAQHLGKSCDMEDDMEDLFILSIKIMFFKFCSMSSNILFQGLWVLRQIKGKPRGHSFEYVALSQPEQASL